VQARPKLLVLGGSEFLGSYLTKSQELAKRFEVIGTFFSSKSKDQVLTYLDSSDFKEVKKLLLELRPELIINCIALTDVDYCQQNPVLSEKINQNFPIVLSEICSDLKIKLIQISTDHFSSSSLIPRTETTEVQPVNYYGEHKLKAESGIISSGCESIILRTNFFGIDGQGKHLLSWIIKSFENKLSFTGYTNVYFSPISIKELITSINLLINNNAKGLFNLSSNESISKFEFAQLVGEIQNSNISQVVPGAFISDPIKSPRPLYMSLSNRRFGTLYNYQFPSIRSMLTQVLHEFPNKTR
jgi:dTDP-4-dehydrorhamnose reductase